VSPLTLSLGVLDQAWAARLRDDPGFAAAVGLDTHGTARLYRGWPTALLEKPSAAAFPRVTWFRVDRQPLSSDPEYVILQSDIWAPKERFDLLDTIDNEMIALLTDGEGGATQWQDSAGNIGVSCAMLGGNDPQDVLPRRTARWNVAWAWDGPAT
jgi:hypothetical protein